MRLTSNCVAHREAACPATLPIAASLVAVLALATAASGATRNIMITGYWPPTNEMVRQFSTNPAQNPGGWKGENWKGSGYNIMSYFPEFPDGQPGQGVGDFEVNYADTSADFWRITAEVNPIAIITFSRGRLGSNWEIEQRNKNRNDWTPDFTGATPGTNPPDPTAPLNFARSSTLPMTQIRDAVNAAGLGVNAYIDTSIDGAGNYLSGYMAYHGVWYQSMHRLQTDPNWCIAAGHIHVGIGTSVEAATAATEITLDELTKYLDTRIPAPSSLAVLGGVFAMARRRR